MPTILHGDSHFKSTTYKPRTTFDYDYPMGLDLKPGSKLHTRIRDRIMERAYESSRVMSARHGDWNNIDHTLTAYIPADEEERLVQNRDSRRPISIVFPNSYTVLETLLSYYMGAFIQDPIFRYEGNSGPDVIGSILLEKVIQQQVIKNKVGLNLHTQARDAFAYGFGVSTPTWKKEYGTQITTKENFFGKKSKVIKENQLLFEGNALDNIDPYLYLPDTTVPIHEPQKGEFSGWIDPNNNYHRLLSDEKNSKELFNVRYLADILGQKSSIYSEDNSGRNTKTGVSTTDNKHRHRTSTAVDIIKMFIRLIPAEWGLGNSDYPEIWYFEVGQEEIVLKALKAGGERYPVSIMAPDFDGYSMSPVSRIEILYGMQGVLDFLFNSHIANVRKAINDMFIYDPYLVNSSDLTNPEAGKLIRLRRPGFGRGVKDVISQFPVSDVTRANVADSAWVVQWMERISGADQSMQGALRQGGPERLTSTEFQGTRAGSVTRLERIAKVVGMQSMQDIGYFFAKHNQMLMSQETYVKASGDWQEVLLKEFGHEGSNILDRGRIKVSPFDLNINYDIIVRDGSVPGGNFSDVWVQLFQTLASSPELAQKLDVVRIFTHIARNLGAKNVNDFVRRGGNIQPQTMDNEQVMEQAQRGNLIPFREAI